MATTWIAGTCCYAKCPATLVMAIGGGMWICWAHALKNRIL